MHFTCICLNVCIETSDTELQPFNLQLDDVERTDEFFNKNLASVSKVTSVNEKHPKLVVWRFVGPWRTFRCHNCSMYIYATNEENDDAPVLVNTNLVSSPEEIESLKGNSAYSLVFGIIINETLKHLARKQVPHRHVNLPNDKSTRIRREKKATKDAISAFAAERSKLFKQFYEKAHNEYNLLTRATAQLVTGKKKMKDVHGQSVKDKLSSSSSLLSSLSSTDVISDDDLPMGMRLTHRKPEKCLSSSNKDDSTSPQPGPAKRRR